MNQKSIFAISRTFMLLVLITLTTIGCSSDDDGGANRVVVTGTIQVQGITTYQYGTHVITDYAIRSSTINLDDFINQSVTVVGNKIDGYPVEGGPEYLEIVEIK